MAIVLGDRNEVLKVISSQDEAVRCSKEDYTDYLENLEVGFLNLNPDIAPTVFHIKKILTAQENGFVESKKLGSSEDGKPMVRLDFIPETVRQSLVKIDEPEGSSFDEIPHLKTGKYSEEFISLLYQVGIASELFTARENSLSGSKSSAAMKKK